MQPRPFLPEVEGLLAAVSEADDEDLVEATRELRRAAVKHDEADLDFVYAANYLQQLLLEKMQR
jgi:hypothetical protein